MTLKKSLAGIFAGLALVFGATITDARANEIRSNTYYCAQLNGNWNTFVNTPRGRVDLINWVRTYSDEWTPKNRCIVVSQRFQRFLDNGTLKYIRTGIVNNQPVLCVANTRGGECPNNNVLITLKPGTNPETVLIKLIDFRRTVGGQTIVLSENDSGFYNDGDFYVDMEKFLEKAAISQ
ncbi:MAG: COP23 domain-containing protein [Xenococcaceae cyanobacterium MO_188.B32]|nr:COP23 domain-containing protein [Xenococcaceae cyanobacterium MO_188.B32]